MMRASGRDCRPSPIAFIYYSLAERARQHAETDRAIGSWIVHQRLDN